MLISIRRKADQSDRSDFVIGCRILTRPFFLDEPDWIPVPANFPPDIIRFKTCTTDRGTVWSLYLERYPMLTAPRSMINRSLARCFASG